MKILQLMKSIVVTSLLFVPTAAFAGGDAHINWFTLTGDENAHAPALGALMITFAIFIGALTYFGRKPFVSFVANRSDEIRIALEEAKQAKDEAEALAREYEQRLDKLDSEIDSIKADFKARGEAETKRMREQAKSSAERIAKDAESTIGAEFDRAQQNLRREASRLAIQIAEEKIKGALKDTDHQRLASSFQDDLQKSANG